MDWWTGGLVDWWTGLYGVGGLTCACDQLQVMIHQLPLSTSLLRLSMLEATLDSFKNIINCCCDSLFAAIHYSTWKSESVIFYLHKLGTKLTKLKCLGEFGAFNPTNIERG